MPIEARIVCDSVNLAGQRLVTYSVQAPRIILAEINTHRMLAKNASSSRAIPISRMIDQVLQDPFIPTAFGKNCPGMQAQEDLDPEETDEALRVWLQARDQAVESARQMKALEVHKQLANRLLEPWMFTNIVISGTEWANFFSLRCHRDAQPEFNRLANLMADLYRTSQPRLLTWGHWHLPFIENGEWAEYTTEELVKMSTARCARVSYKTHEGKRPTLMEDLGLHDRLLYRHPVHASPSEHPAYAVADPDHQLDTGCYRGFMPYRKTLPRENVTVMPWVEEVSDGQSTV